MTVIGAGLPRTGTSSMKAALERLGFGPCHHMFNIMTNPALVDRWLSVTTEGPVNWEEVFEGFRSAVDWPASHFWREQAEAYPDAKVVLTVRDPHAWYVSMQVLITDGPGRDLPEDLPEAAAAVFQRMMRLGPVLDHITQSVFAQSFRDGPLDEEVAVAAFERHVAAVKEALPQERLLVFDVREGWEPLCRFLDVPVPDGEPFPHLNDAKSMQQMLAKLMAGGEIESPFAH
ncbi:sulfotransferase family protein [Nonomuraea sp. K274]|uniref:Sulfotransferase family protein n=1 Tax=Nonomuraea cypriaca TaxID=1187855 RepID=A0A931AFL1_9ACTN|nr:sulfotransferase family protein [Nonomuraea cypriaca]